MRMFEEKINTSVRPLEEFEFEASFCRSNPLFILEHEIFPLKLGRPHRSNNFAFMVNPKQF